MYHPEYGRALYKLREVHELYRQQIDPKVKDVRLAMYYLTGGAITQANFAVKTWAMGDLNTPFRSKRFIDEAYLLIIGMIAVPDRDRFVRRFFTDEIVDIDPEKYKSEFMAATGMNEEVFGKWLKTRDEIRHRFSKGVHVTFKSVAYNSDIDTAVFDYDATSLAYHPIDGFDFANFVIIPTIDAVTAPSAAYGVEDSALKEIYELREKIQEIAIAGHESRTGKKIERPKFD